MRENCFDIGTIQAFLDGELASDALDNVARHIALCDDCALQLATAEEETAFAFNALEHEFNTLIPTQRLWTKINDSIERERKSFWTPILAFLKNPAMATFAAFLIVFALFVGYLNSSNNNQPFVAEAPKEKQSAVMPVVDSDAPVKTADETPAVAQTKDENPRQQRVSAPQEKVNKNNRAVNANFAANQQKNLAPNTPNQISIPKVQTAVYQYLPGEESYVKTIATLEKTIDSRKDEVLRPSSRISFERNLAIINDAISKMKAEVKKNPKNESAKQILLASYQNKVDLLNSVAAKSELMAYSDR